MECPVCLQEELDKNIFCYTDCEHSICKECFDKWLDKGERSCPICRNQIKFYNYQDNNYRIVFKFNRIIIQPTPLVHRNVRIITRRFYNACVIYNGVAIAAIFTLLGLNIHLYHNDCNQN